MSDCRIAITGVGIVSCLGSDVQDACARLIAGESGFCVVPQERYPKSHSRVVAMVSDQNFDPSTVLTPGETRQLPRYIKLGVVAGKNALNDSQWQVNSEQSCLRSGIIFGTGFCGLSDLVWSFEKQLTTQPSRMVRPITLITAAPNALPAMLSMKTGFRGQCVANSDACATGTIALINAAHAIKRGELDVVITGASEAPLNPIALNAFSKIGALVTGHEDSPQTASKPWDKTRNGFVLGEGAGALVVERWEHALARGAKIYGELCGAGIASDSFHITHPNPDGDGQIRSMRMALKEANIDYQDIDYVNCHATSTPLGDTLEILNTAKVLGSHAQRVAFSSFKGAIGHSLAACGSIELALALTALKDHSTIPPTINLNEPDDQLSEYNLVAKKPQQAKVRYMMKNSFGFGGINASVVIKIPS